MSFYAAVERSMSGAVVDAREALINAAVDAMSSYNRALGGGGGGSSSGHSPAVLAPVSSLRLMPIYVLGMLKHVSKGEYSIRYGQPRQNPPIEGPRSTL